MRPDRSCRITCALCSTHVNADQSGVHDRRHAYPFAFGENQP